eukprot:PhM_4_TR15115/c0_g1_i1/m.53010
MTDSTLRAPGSATLNRPSVHFSDVIIPTEANNASDTSNNNNNNNTEPSEFRRGSGIDGGGGGGLAEFEPEQLQQQQQHNQSARLSVFARSGALGTSSSGGPPTTTTNPLAPSVVLVRNSIDEPSKLQVAEQQRTERMKEVLDAFRVATRSADSLQVRYWYACVVVITAYAYISFTRVVMYGAAGDSAEVGFRLVMSVVMFIDFILHWKLISPCPYRGTVWLDIVPALPLEVLLFVFPDLGSVPRAVIAGARASKMLRIPDMFGSSMPDVIDAHYVTFYFKVLPTALFVFWFMVFLHTLVVIRLLCAETEENYHAAVTWVWVILTSAPLDVEIHSSSERALSGILMTVSMILQGYVVGAMSMLVFSYNVKEENRTAMLTTLEMLKHYELPPDARDEVLSFQHHTLAESTVRATSHATLDKLPPAMLRQIQLYMKMQVLSNVPLFTDASEACRADIANVMVPLVIEPDEDIIEAGSVGNAMYFLLHGLADVTLPNGLCVATLRRGDFFGEIALLSSDSLRKATVTSLMYCDLLELSRSDFDDAIARFDEFYESISKRREEQLAQAAAAATAADADTFKADGAAGDAAVALAGPNDDGTIAPDMLNLDVRLHGGILGRRRATLVEDDESTSPAHATTESKAAPPSLGSIITPASYRRKRSHASMASTRSRDQQSHHGPPSQHIHYQQQQPQHGPMGQRQSVFSLLGGASSGTFAPLYNNNTINNGVLHHNANTPNAATARIGGNLDDRLDRVWGTLKAIEAMLHAGSKDGEHSQQQQQPPTSSSPSISVAALSVSVNNNNNSKSVAVAKS